MCWSLYLASGNPLHDISWDPEFPGFHVAQLGDADQTRRLGLSLPYKKVLGSHTQCGCGFADDEDTDRAPVLQALAKYLSCATSVGNVELALLWEGQEIAEGTKPETFCSGDFDENSFPLADGFTEGPVLAVVRP